MSVTRESNGLTLSATTRYRGGDAGKRTGKSETNNTKLTKKPDPILQGVGVLVGWPSSMVGFLFFSIGVLGLWSVVKNRIEKVTKARRKQKFLN